MGVPFVAALACPRCHGPLVAGWPRGSEIREGTLQCLTDGIVYPVDRGVPLLVDPGRLEGVAHWAEAYAKVWAADGWGSPNEAYLLDLPYRDITGRRSAEWRVKARSMKILFRILDAHKQAGRVVDLGCGVGWLSYHLARRGFEVYAVDVVRGPFLGLDAAATYVRHGPAFCRVWGELQNPPFLDASIDVVVCNASLHYAPDLKGALREIARILRADGLLVVMNSPVHWDPRSAARAQSDFQWHLTRLGAPPEIVLSYHHLVRSELVDALTRFVGPTREEAFDPGRGFRWIRWLKGHLLRLELASFPILVARKVVSQG